MTLLDPELKDEADGTPRKVVEWCGGRHSPCSPKDERCHEEPHWRLGPTLGQQVNDHGSNGTNDEENKQTRVDLARREHAGRSEEAPDDGG